MLVDETGRSRVPSFRNPGGSAPGDGPRREAIAGPVVGRRHRPSLRVAGPLWQDCDDGTRPWTRRSGGSTDGTVAPNRLSDEHLLVRQCRLETSWSIVRRRSDRRRAVPGRPGTARRRSERRRTIDHEVSSRHCLTRRCSSDRRFGATVPSVDPPLRLVHGRVPSSQSCHSGPATRNDGRCRRPTTGPAMASRRGPSPGAEPPGFRNDGTRLRPVSSTSMRQDDPRIVSSLQSSPRLAAGLQPPVVE